MIELTTERIIFGLVVIIGTPAAWVLSRYFVSQQVEAWKRVVSAVKQENIQLKSELEETKDRAKNLGEKLLQEKEKSLDLKHKVVDMIKANQDSFKAFDKYLEERGL